MTKRALTFFFALFTTTVLAGCGVRGRPQPPETPPELGRGQPSFKRATERYAFPTVPNPESTPVPRKRRAPPGDAN